MATLLLVVALICFLLAAVGLPASRINLTALGLFFWVLSILLGGPLQAIHLGASSHEHAESYSAER